jgi:hypothetical protein
VKGGTLSRELSGAEEEKINQSRRLSGVFGERECRLLRGPPRKIFVFSQKIRFWRLTLDFVWLRC